MSVASFFHYLKGQRKGKSPISPQQMGITEDPGCCI